MRYTHLIIVEMDEVIELFREIIGATLASHECLNGKRYILNYKEK